MKYLNTIILFLSCIAKLAAQDLQVSLYKENQGCELGKASVSIITGFQPYHYLWSDGSINEIDYNLTAGDYYVTITDDHNNDTTIYFNIGDVDCDPIAQKCFTPNGDMINDTWSISNLDYYPTFELFVFNRWGQQIHHQFNVYIPWDGRHLGIPVPDATYYFVLYFSRSDKNKFIK